MLFIFLGLHRILFREKIAKFIVEYIWFVSSLSNRKSESALQEWGIVELQGDLEVRGNAVMENQFIGDLNYDKYGQPVNLISECFCDSLETVLEL